MDFVTRIVVGVVIVQIMLIFEIVSTIRRIWFGIGIIHG
jgi:hypothetical protein